MVKAPFSLSFGPDRDAKAVLKMVHLTWPQRFKAMQSKITYDAAETVRQDILSKLPTGKEWREYRKNLAVARVEGITNGAAHTVHAPVKARDVKKNDASSNVIYIKVKRAARGGIRRTRVLQQFSPWTMDTLPFKPAPTEATVVQRKVREDEVESIRRARRRDSSKWKAALAAAGAADTRNKSKTLTTKKMKAIPDVAFSALRLEFGMGGGKAKAHWRPAILNFVKTDLPKLAKKKSSPYVRAWREPKYRDWRKWEKEADTTVSKTQAKSFTGFQKAIQGSQK